MPLQALLSSRLTNEEYYLFGKLFQEAIGTDQIVLGGNGADQGVDRGIVEDAWDRCFDQFDPRDSRNADCILVIGVDPAETHPIIKNEIHLAIRKNRAQLIVLGSLRYRPHPGHPDFASFTSGHPPPRETRDGGLLSSMA